MLIVSGCSALSDFNQKKLLTKLQSKFPKIINIKASYQHLIDEQHQLNEQQQRILENILSYNENIVTTTLTANTNSFLVMPRLGTRSAWSSKATDILNNCGITMINSIERAILYTLSVETLLTDEELADIKSMLHDRMVETTIDNLSAAKELFTIQPLAKLVTIPLLQEEKQALFNANKNLGLALTTEDIDYLHDQFIKLAKDPTDIELMMYAQINSEHCRHKIFNATFNLNGKIQPLSLFDMIRNTHKHAPANTLSAYKDNAAVIRGYTIKRFYSDPVTGEYNYKLEDTHLLLKVETHNHPTAIAPTEGAATGVGGEIRDEGATGRGSRPKFGLTGYSVSNLNIPDFQQPWEQCYGKPYHMSSAFEIMQQAPIGGANFNNEFGRPNLLGYFRTYEQKLETSLGTQIKGYHKPIMIAGGLGIIKAEHVNKNNLDPGTNIIVLGGSAMKIGLGGGTASSIISSDEQIELDFASVQRYNPEMERKCQEVIDQCWKLGGDNPIEFIHDVGAGGLSNAIPELLTDNNLGGMLELRNIINDDYSMSPLALWCNESQERYVIAVTSVNLDRFKEICARERCPMAVVGMTTAERQLKVADNKFKNTPINIPMDLLFKKSVNLNINAKTVINNLPALDLSNVCLEDAVKRVLQLPTVASKNFLITIGDRSVGGLVYRDQMVGKWQVPVADCAVTAASFKGYHGDAMSMGERTPIALINPAASARMAVAEALTNIAATDIGDISSIKLSANWMCATSSIGEYANLFDAVAAIGMDFCVKLGISIPVGKDSLSMQTKWKENDKIKEVISPLSLIISACSVIKDIRKTITPELKTQIEATDLLLIDLGNNNNRLGGSALAQVYNQLGNDAPDINANILKNFFIIIQLLINQKLLLAYHDRSDGGLLACAVEMAFAGRTGLTINLPAEIEDTLEFLFNEELGAIIQIHSKDTDKIMELFSGFGMSTMVRKLGTLNSKSKLVINHNNKIIYSELINKLQCYWASTSYYMQSLRDNENCANEEYQQISDKENTGLFAKLSFNLDKNPALIYTTIDTKPKIAILREQGVNGNIEMAAAFDKAGFSAIDVHMTDILTNKYDLNDFNGLVACGGFSYGDVLGAGGGWAKSILYNNKLLDIFAEFFSRKNTFTLGVCNGCQMLAHLKDLIPGAEDWPNFTTNDSNQFESRLCMVEILPNPSIFFDDMIGSQLPIVVAHQQGKVIEDKTTLKNLTANSQISLQYIDTQGKATMKYPLNPNGSANAMAGFTSTDGRVTIMMPHPERVFRTIQHSWHPENWNEDAPFMRMFYNARNWIN